MAGKAHPSRHFSRPLPLNVETSPAERLLFELVLNSVFDLPVLPELKSVTDFCPRFRFAIVLSVQRKGGIFYFDRESVAHVVALEVSVVLEGQVELGFGGHIEILIFVSDLEGVGALGGVPNPADALFESHLEGLSGPLLLL